MRPSAPITVLASAARTATVTTGIQSKAMNVTHRGVLIVIDVTAASATPSVVFTLQSNNSDGLTWTDDLASAAITGTGTTLLLAHPDAPDRANVSENTALGQKWRVKATHADADSITYSVKAYLLA